MPTIIWQPTNNFEATPVVLGVPATSLSTAVVKGVAISSLSTAALPSAVPAGSTLAVSDGTSTIQVQVTSAGAAQGATTIPITSTTPTVSLPVGSRVSGWGGKSERETVVVPQEAHFVEPGDVAAVQSYLQGLPGGGTVAVRAW